jgi:hypothetical protein
MNYQDESNRTYKIIYETLYCILPKVLIQYYICEYIDIYNYICTINSEQLFDHVHFNKQLKTICCSSITRKRLFDYRGNGTHCLSLINMKFFRQINFYHKVIHFDENIILTYNIKSERINKYILVEHKYKYVSESRIIIQYQSAHVQDQYIYICYKSNRKKYCITVFDVKTLQEVSSIDDNCVGM